MAPKRKPPEKAQSPPEASADFEVVLRRMLETPPQPKLPPEKLNKASKDKK